MKKILVACHDCDMIHEINNLEEGFVAKCSRCNAVLIDRKQNSIEKTLAFTLAGLILFFIANSFPFLSFKLHGRIQETTLITGVGELFSQHLWGPALLVFATTIFIPLLQLSGLLYILIPIQYGRSPKKLPEIFRLITFFEPWSMMEVFMLGILVSVVKLGKMAEIIPGISVYAFAGLIFVMAAIKAGLDRQLVWEKWEQYRCQS